MLQHAPSCAPFPRLDASALFTAFQPILDLRHSRIYGYEALTRGPAGTAMEPPAALFSVARALGRGAELELLAVRCAVARFAKASLAGKLFVNFSPAVLAERREDPETLVALLRHHGLAPNRLVIEVTEDGAMTDSSPAWGELLRCRSLGLGVAIDDLGEGFASLRLWSELRPEYVKIAKHFVQGVHRDPIKLEMARAIQQIAHVSGASVIAEGIEQEADFQAIRNLGISHGQGYLIGRGEEKPGSGRHAHVHHGELLRQAPDVVEHHVVAQAEDARDVAVGLRVEAHAVGEDAMAAVLLDRFLRVE
jgi:EAL domain-containing protein (putative c-di-GMP-specific phosphodiesterase class I)